MIERRPFAPPEDPTDAATDDTFSELPGDKELDFNDRRHPDNFEPESDDEYWDDEDEYGDDDLEFIEDEIAGY